MYQTASLLVQLAVTMAAADGEVSERELEQIEALLAAMPELSAFERTRLLARAHLLAQDPPGFTGLKKRIEVLDAAQKGAVADLIVAMATADGLIDPAEVKVLLKLFPLLGLGTSDVYRRIQALATGSSTPAAEPVVAKTAEARAGFRIPRPPPESDASGVALDMALVRAKLVETSKVEKLLGSIFAEDGSEPRMAAQRPLTPPAPSVPETPSGPLVRTLDARHSKFARQLADRVSWSRAELEAMSAALGLLPDGALETVNEAAFEACGNPVWSGDDPIEIDGDVAKELCA